MEPQADRSRRRARASALGRRSCCLPLAAQLRAARRSRPRGAGAAMAAIAAARDEVRRCGIIRRRRGGRDPRIPGRAARGRCLERDRAARPSPAACADSAWRDALAGEIAGYEACRGRVFPRPRGRPRRRARPRAAASLGAHDSPGVAAGRSWLRATSPPSLFLGIDWSQGGAIVLGGGSATSHVAMLARARGVPMVVGLGGKLETLCTARWSSTASTGSVVARSRSHDAGRGRARKRGRQSRARPRRRSRLREPAHHARTGRAIAVMINVADAGRTRQRSIRAICDGIGLVRTEFLFHERCAARRGDASSRSTAASLAWAAGRPVTIRTLDAGGDKPIPGYTVDGETNPFLGMRGMRLSLRAAGRLPRAAARAGARGRARAPQGHAADGDHCRRARAGARAARGGRREPAGRGRAGGAARRSASWSRCRRPPSPSTASTPAFFSIGSNDLDAVRHGRGARQRRVGGACRADASRPCFG